MTLGSISTNNTLPLDLEYMYAQKTGKKVKIVWETSDELQMKKYAIERSFDGVTFEQIGEVEAKGQSGKQVYEEIDHFPSPGDNYYRIKMISLEDQSQFSQIATVHFAPEVEVEIFPNPVVDKFQISGLELDEAENISGSPSPGTLFAYALCHGDEYSGTRYLLPLYYQSGSNLYSLPGKKINFFS